MPAKEAQARIKINQLLEAAGWRFFDGAQGRANVVLEPHVSLTQAQVDAMGSDFEVSSKGFIDFLLLDERGFPLVVLEAKAESKNPLVGKEQARRYAKAQNCRFVILSNGNLHYLWDLKQGNPQLITAFPAPEAIKGYARFQPDPARLIAEDMALDYIARTQMPAYDAAEIEAEQALVHANRELVRRMETKIKAAIDRVWGHAPAVALASPVFAESPSPPFEEAEVML